MSKTTKRILTITFNIVLMLMFLILIPLGGAGLYFPMFRVQLLVGTVVWFTIFFVILFGFVGFTIWTRNSE